jgi:tetratricopeptide (TPR) repeat protein
MSSTSQTENAGVVDYPRIVESSRLTLPDRYLCLLLALITFGLYFCTRKFDFVQFDDPAYVADNVYLRHGITLASLHWVITAIVVANWHPLTLLTELILSTLFGPTAHTFHLASALFHTANTVLLFMFFRKSTHRVWPAFFIAALWAWHPLRAESVAWISELKDVLCAFFWLLCMLAYRRYVQHRTSKSYLIVVLLLVLALLSKPMAVTLPLVLLLLDFWPLSDESDRSFHWFIYRALEKLPMLGLCVGIMVTSMRTQRGFVGPLSPQFTAPIRIENSVIAVCDYLRDLVLPRHLGIFYVHPLLLNQTIPLASVLLGCLLLILITALALWRWKSNPYLLTGWLWFLGTLVPVLGLVRAGDQQRADRYTYLPSIGILFAAVMLISDQTIRRTIPRAVAIAGGCAVLLALLIASRHQVNIWQNTHTLFTSLREQQPNNYMALSYYADELQSEGKLDQAIEVAKQAIEIAPASAWPHTVYAGALLEAGKLDDALDQARRCLALDPGSSQHWDLLARVREAQANKALAEGKTADADLHRKEAIADFHRAVITAPDDPQVLEHLAFQLMQVPGNLDEAIADWEKAVQLSPEYAQAQGDLADGYLLKGDLPKAIQHFKAAIDDGSKNPKWETKLAWLVATSPQASPADVLPMVDIAKDACDRTKNQEASALDAYAACLARVARYDDAVMAAQQAIAQANAAHQPLVAAGIAKRLALYQNQQIYVAEDPATQPTTAPVMGPSTAP